MHEGWTVNPFTDEYQRNTNQTSFTVSSLNFLIPSRSICLGINKILNYYVLINYIVVMANGITVYYDVMFKLLLS